MTGEPQHGNGTVPAAGQKKRSIVSPASIAVALGVLFVILARGPASGQVFNKVLATVSNEVITLSDYQRFAVGTGKNVKTDEVDEALLKTMIEEKVVLQEAIRRSIEVSDGEVDAMVEGYKEDNGLSQKDLERELAKYGLTTESFRKLMKDRIMAQKLINTDVDSKVVVTDGEIEEYYRGHKGDYLINPENVEVRAIFIRLPEGASVTEITELKLKALWIKEQVKKGVSFEKLAEQYSSESMKERGGTLGGFGRGELIPALDKKAFSLKKGEVGEPIWVQDGVYILHLIDRKEERYKTLNEARAEIAELLKKEKREKVFHDWMRRLWEKASVTIN